MTSYRIRGSVQLTAPRFATSNAVAVTRHRRLQPSTAREGGGIVEAQSDELVRVELTNGFVYWTRVDALMRERGRKSSARDGDGAWEIELNAPSRGAGAEARGQRGLLSLGIKVLEFFGIDIIAGAAAGLGKACEEKQLGNAPGLYRCSLGDAFALSHVVDTTIPASGGKPLLIFLHGTASSCKGSFAKLWSEKTAAVATRKAMAEKYEDRAYAWEHRSLTQSPIRNALELAQCLPPGAEIDLVSHSRGGLVGELLCLAQRTSSQGSLSNDLITQLFAADRTMAEQLGLSPLESTAAQERDSAYDSDRKALLKLLQELDKKKPRIRRFIRVACPARGTTLASGRLDRWLSVVNYLMGDGLIADGADFLLHVVKQRTDPRTLPGLEAMMPGSALTRLLQQPALATEADLTVISGDIEGDGLWGQLKLFIADWFYGADHDLVVNTGSMYGGLRRPENGARFLLDRGQEVNHFNYFDNDKSVRWLAAGLLRVDGGDGGFQPIAAAPREEPRWREAVRRSRNRTQIQPLAVVIPGIMGSSLKVKGEHVWLDYWTLMWGGLGKLNIDATEVESTGILDDFYAPLLEFFARSHQVEIFPYDWRLSVRDAAKALASKLADWLPIAEKNKQAVHLLAHSMGGLVVRAMIADGGEGAAVWRRIQALPNSRFLMLGTPNHGSHEAMRWLTGCNPTEYKLSLLDMTQGIDEIVDLVRRYPGLVELLPFGPLHEEFGQEDTWKNLRAKLKANWKTVENSVLRPARATWSLLRQSPPDPESMVYVAGCQDATVADYRLEAYEDSTHADRKRLEFDATRYGDGTVTWESGKLAGVSIWYAPDTAHDELCARQNLLPGYLDLLMTGKTTRLSDIPPNGSRRERSSVGTKELSPMPLAPPIDDIPNAGDARTLIFGPSRPITKESRPISSVIEVGVLHGDLAYARHPVLVGHYIADMIVSAEAALDQRMGGMLAKRQHLGLYPGPLRTHAIFNNDDPKGKPSGAIVVGLGQVGGLSVAMLQTSIRDALLDYAFQVAHSTGDHSDKNGVRSAAVSCLLVGTGQGGIAVSDSVEAILRGAMDANKRLKSAEMDHRVLIDKLELLEIYEDTAIAATEALESLLEDGELAAGVIWANRIVEEGQGRQRRVKFEEAPGWWRYLEIIEESTGGLRFIATTDRARAEVTQATGQLRLAEGFIRQASRSPISNPEVAKTLFEMLLPNRLKDSAPSQGDMVLLVDRASARYPWELLEDRWSQNHRPWAIASGMVRQFKTTIFRSHPAHASAHTAYVVGNPNLEEWKQFPDLPGAREEARKVATLLGARGYKVQDCIDGSADQIMDGLHKDAWRILHLAGHGEHLMPIKTRDNNESECTDAESSPSKKERMSGMVIGKKTFLTPVDVQQMRWTPELVFINCCHLGKTQAPGHGEYSPLAANLAVEFIGMGVKAVVAAGWAVDDAAASAFAESFYTHMLLHRRPFGEAVRAAREEIWIRYPNANTWGAYQCYGDPGFRLTDDGDTTPPLRSYHAPAELIADLDNLRERIRVQIKQTDDDIAVGKMRDQITALLIGIPKDYRENWQARADVAAAIGFVWGETGDFGAAVEWLDRALAAKDGDCPVRAMEQCGNFRARRAGLEWQRLRDVGKNDPDMTKSLATDIEIAIRELDMVCRRGPTKERLNLLGSACKRLAWVSSEHQPRLEALVNMSQYYQRAFTDYGATDPYPFSNWAVAAVLAKRLDPTYDNELLVKLDDECRRIAALAHEQNNKSPNFWSAVGEADCELARLLFKDGATQNDIDRITGIYRAARVRGASPRELSSVQEHLDFLIDLVAAPDSDSDLAKALQRIRASL